MVLRLINYFSYNAMTNIFPKSLKKPNLDLKKSESFLELEFAN